MDEGKFRPSVLAALRPLDAVFVENVMGSGMPDINYVEGWLELKWLKAWPVRPGTVVKLPEFTPQQRIFLLNRCRAGGSARFLLRVGKEWILLPGIWSALRLGKTATKAEILAAAERYWPVRLIGAELVEHLRNPPPSHIALSSLLSASDVI